MHERVILSPPAVITELESVRSSAPDKCVLHISKLAYPPLFRGPRYLAVIRAFCDESYDGESRIYTIAGFVGRDKEWASLATRWRNRCLRENVRCYHAADCEGAYGAFVHLTPKQIVDLNTQLVDEVVGTRIVGFATSLVLEDYRKVSASSEKARRILGSSPYFLTMQTFLVSVCGEIRDSRPNYRVAFVFDQQEEFSGRAKQLYDEVKVKNPNIAPCMGTLVYADRERFIPLQVADKLAYEAMKNLLNLRHDPKRKERIALTRMKDGRVIQTLNYLDEETLHQIVATNEGAIVFPLT
jgi:hypothetical protein